MQAIILAGGKGTRLAERLAGKPKPLVDVCGIPLLERQIRNLEGHGIDDIVVLVNHAADQILDFLAGNRFSARISVIDDGAPRGTAGAVMACLDVMAPQSLIIYGDTLFDIDIAHMLANHDATGADATLLLHPNDHPADSDLVALDAEGYVSAFHTHPHPPGADLRNLVNAALYVVERSALAQWRDMAVPSDFGHDLFPAMIAAGQRLFGYISAEYIKDLGTPARLDKVERHFTAGIVERSSRRVPQHAVFIDRDGTLNLPAGHINTPDAIELIPGTSDALRRLNEAGLRTILVTNQPVIARGECDLATLERIHGRLEMLLSQSGAYLDRIYFCPHHPHAGYPGEVAALKIECDCRKPAAGMIERGMDDFHIDRHRSWMVGDTAADIGAAHRSGLLCALVRTGAPEVDPEASQAADIVLPDFAAAASLILETYPILRAMLLEHVAQIEDGDCVPVPVHAHPATAAVLRNELRGAGHTVIEVDAATDVAALPLTAILVVPGCSQMPASMTDRRIYSALMAEPTRK